MHRLTREIQLLDIEELEALNLIYLQQIFQPRFSGKPLLLFVNLQNVGFRPTYGDSLEDPAREVEHHAVRCFITL
jgi:hypothetical protein